VKVKGEECFTKYGLVGLAFDRKEGTLKNSKGMFHRLSNIYKLIIKGNTLLPK